MIRCILIAFLLVGLSGMVAAQEIGQTIRGKVSNIDNHSELIGVTVVLLDENNQQGTVTDEKGNFRLDNVPVGRHQLEFSYVGYENLILSEILVESGKEQVLDINLAELSTDLQVVVVVGQATNLNRNYIPVSVKTLSIEETFRFPATFYDPARLAVSFPGVANDNDQANGISIRGHSPNHLRWMLEGVEIVNPNHTNNAGTASDRPTANGGGVNILSAQLLGTSNFITGAFPVGYGNALSGIMDMRLRKGNDEQHEFTGQIGLIGIDVAAEGPLAGGASYLVNYRYSTLGLLSAMGVNLGDEEINFQDIAFHLNFPIKRANVTLFGMGGRSSNVFEAQRDTTLWEFQKDNQDIRYENDMGAVGATFTLPIGNQSIWKTTLAYSGLHTTRQADLLDNNLTLQSQFEFDDLTNQIAGLSSSFQHKINVQHRLRVGLNTNLRSFKYLRSSETITNVGGETSGLLTQPYASWQWQPNDRWVLNAGLQLSIFTLGTNTDTVLEPRFSLTRKLADQQKISLAYSLYSQTQLPQLYLLNSALNLSRAQQVVLAYENQINTQTNFGVEAYVQQANQVAIVSPVSGTIISSYNFLDDFYIPTSLFDNYTNDGEALSYGLELNLHQRVNNNFYYLANASLYQSLYVDSEEQWISSRYDGNYIFNLTAGKEWNKTRDNRKIILGVNGRASYLGGFRRTPIDDIASAQQGTTVFDETQPFSIKQEDYFKLDLRIYYKRNKQKYSNTLALDIQNVTNQDNLAYYYFDTRQQAVIRKKQLGLIPILSYRIEF